MNRLHYEADWRRWDAEAASLALVELDPCADQAPCYGVFLTSAQRARLEELARDAGVGDREMLARLLASVLT